MLGFHELYTELKIMRVSLKFYANSVLMNKVYIGAARLISN